MEHIGKIIERELKNLDEIGRERFRELFLKNFSILFQNIKDRNSRFEGEIIKNFKSEIKEEDIYVALIPKDEYYLYENIFFPIAKREENLKADLEIGKISKELYIDIPYDEIEEFDGKILDVLVRLNNGNEYAIQMILKRNMVYEEKIEELYKVFRLNNISWKSILNPYMKRMFLLELYNVEDYIIEDIYNNISNEDSYNNIFIFYNEFEIDLDELLKEEYILSWNISEEEIVSDGVKSFTQDKKYLEHILTFTSAENVYIYPSIDYQIYNIDKLNDEQILIITDDKKDILWRILKIKKIDIDKLKRLEYRIFNNRLRDNFLNRLRLKNNIKIRTEGEICRVIKSFSIFDEYFIFKGVKILDSLPEDSIEIYELNSFIIDEFIQKNEQKLLQLKVDIKLYDNYILDILSFIISELQLYLPEYRCCVTIVEDIQ